MPLSSSSSTPRPPQSRPGIEALSFTSLDRLINEMDTLARATDPQPGRVERIAMRLGVLGAISVVLLQLLLPTHHKVLAISVGLAIELTGFAVGLCLMLWRELGSIRHARRSMAASLDSDYAHYDHCVEQLRRFPITMRKRLQRYVHARSTRILSHTRLLTGGFERFAIVPLLLALYLQLKDWRMSDWSALERMTLAQSLIIFALFLVFLGASHLLYIRSRVEAIAGMLAEATTRDEQEGRHSVTSPPLPLPAHTQPVA